MKLQTGFIIFIILKMDGMALKTSPTRDIITGLI